MKYDLVVARYNEDLKWLNELQRDKFNFKIYNKGIDDVIGFTSIKLNNIGFDAHTFIKYIVDNYNDLPTYVIFYRATHLIIVKILLIY